ncbi:MAG: FecR domain-containing protein [Candidatus Magasanikbacteria bacterium]|nr:FecR domain-containing protein [Candidatus Magasanikbacteria bacterium]
MKHTIGILAIFVLLIAGAMLFSGCGKKTAETNLNVQQTEEQKGDQTKDTGTMASKPWIQVIKDGAFLITSNTEKIVLKTGDEVDAGVTIETDKNGLANIFFSDGSVARLDSQTKITISAGMYDVKTKTLTVRIKLIVGNLWSKIMKLATPESVWEVRTTNAVAAVRGSAFGMSYSRGKTRIIGSEHIIAVNAVNPETDEVIGNQQAAVEEDKYLEIFDATVLDYASIGKEISEDVKQVGDAVLGEEWVKSSLEADEKINDRLQAIEDGGMTSEEALDEYREEIIKEFEQFTSANPDDVVFDIVTSSDDSINLLDVEAPVDDAGVVEPGSADDSGTEIIIEPDTGSTSTPTNPNSR